MKKTRALSGPGHPPASLLISHLASKLLTEDQFSRNRVLVKLYRKTRCLIKWVNVAVEKHEFSNLTYALYVPGDRLSGTNKRPKKKLLLQFYWSVLQKYEQTEKLENCRKLYEQNFRISFESILLMKIQKEKSNQEKKMKYVYHQSKNQSIHYCNFNLYH